MPDKYDDEVARLTRVDDQAFAQVIREEWAQSTPLFQFLTPDGHWENRADGVECGCPSMVMRRSCDAWTDELTEAVHKLPIPKYPDEPITKADLPAFAAAQRLADQLLNRQ